MRICLLLGVVEFLVIIQHSPVSSLHHVPLNGTRSNGVDQVNHWQAGADQFVLEKSGKQSQTQNAALCFLKHTMLSHTHLEAADLCVFAFLTQGGVDPAEDDLISDLLSITQI